MTPTAVLCPSCTVTMPSEDHAPHLAICVSHEGTTRLWLEARHAPVPEPIAARKPHPRLQRLAMIVACSLAVLNILLLIAAGTIDLWWRP